MSVKRLGSAALTVAACTVLAVAADYAEPVEQTRFDAALEAGGPVLAEVSAPWCPTCRAEQAILAEILAGPACADFATFEVDFDTRKDVLRAFGAQVQSTLIVFASPRRVEQGGDPVGPRR